MFFAAMRGMNPEAARLMRLMGLTSFEALLSQAYQVDRDLQEERESAQRRDDAMFLRFRDMFFSRRSNFNPNNLRRRNGNLPPSRSFANQYDYFSDAYNEPPSDTDYRMWRPNTDAYELYSTDNSDR